MFRKRSIADHSEGLRAYHRYHNVMSVFSDYYNIDMDRVVAVFVA